MADYNSNYTGQEIDEAVGAALDTFVVHAVISNTGAGYAATFDKTPAETLSALSSGKAVSMIVNTENIHSSGALYRYAFIFGVDDDYTLARFAVSTTGMDDVPFYATASANSESWIVDFTVFCPDLTKLLGYEGIDAPSFKMPFFDGNDDRVRWDTVEYTVPFSGALTQLIEAACLAAGGGKTTLSTLITGDLADVAYGMCLNIDRYARNGRGSVIIEQVGDFSTTFKVTSTGYSELDENNNFVVVRANGVVRDSETISGGTLSDFSYIDVDLVFSAKREYDAYTVVACVTAEEITATII